MEVIFDSKLPTMTVLPSLFVHSHLVFVVYPTYICIFDELKNNLLMAVIALMCTSVPIISFTLRLLSKEQEYLVPFINSWEIPGISGKFIRRARIPAHPCCFSRSRSLSSLPSSTTVSTTLLRLPSSYLSTAAVFCHS